MLYIFFAFSLFLSNAHAVYLEKTNINDLKKSRIAYYPGSFDPLHLGHVDVVRTILNKGLADYVLIYAIPNSDQSKKRTSFAVRFAMLESLYANHPHVLITKLMPADMQDRLQPLFHHAKFSVVIGSDIVNTYFKTTQYDSIWMHGLPIRQTNPDHAETSTGAVMAIPAREVIAFNREADDLSYLKRIYKGRPVVLLTAKDFPDLSSTKTRLCVKQGEDSLSDMVPPEVVKIIQENALYQE
jgi:cytidyltransferase-like protein